MNAVQEFNTIDGNFCKVNEHDGQKFNFRVWDKKDNRQVFIEMDIKRKRVLQLFELLGIDFINPLYEKVTQ